MRIATVIVPVLLGLAAAPAPAQAAGTAPAGGAAPAKGGQGEMSYEEYLGQRAKMLLRMQGASPQPGQQPAQDAASKAERDSSDGQGSRYGQGYAARKSAARKADETRAEHPRGERPRTEHPRTEHPRTEHQDRPQVERPGRP